MENTKEAMLFDIIMFFYQLESMLKNHNSMLSDKISEGDIVSSSLAFNNSLIVARVKLLIKEHKELEEYSKSDEFNRRLKDVLSGLQTKTSEDFGLSTEGTKKEDLVN